jgi:CheY-like chemotaxis protein
MNSAPSLRPIVLVDDSEDDLFLLKRLLVKAGIQNPMLTFADGADAVPYLESAASAANSSALPWVIITDLKMPRMNGLEFVRWVRATGALCELPIVMISTSSEPEDAQHAKAAGADVYLSKYPDAQLLGGIVRKPHALRSEDRQRSA